MKMNNWIDAEKNIIELYKKESYVDIKNYVEANLQNINQLINTGDKTLLEQANKRGVYIANRFLHYIENDEKLLSVFYLGMLKECIDILSQRQYKEVDEKYIESYTIHLVKATKNMERLILLLGDAGELTQSKIKDEFMLSKSSISEFMSKAENMNIVRSTKQGKFKFSTLTDSGQKIYAQLRKKEQEEQLLQKQREYEELQQEIKSPYLSKKRSIYKIHISSSEHTLRNSSNTFLGDKCYFVPQEYACTSHNYEGIDSKTANIKLHFVEA